MTDLTLERIKMTVDYEIGYSSADGRESAIAGAKDGAVTMRGAGANGLYTAQRLGSWIATREMDTAEIIAAIHERANQLEGDDLASFGRALLYRAAAIVGRAEGPLALSHTMLSLSISAESAISEGCQRGEESE